MIHVTNRGTLNETAKSDISNALRVAAEQYKRDAQTMSENLGPQHGLVDTFNDQAETVIRWANLIDDAEEVIIR
jgi:hypothetical protein